MSLVLHFHPLSSYCHKVLIGLYERGTPFEARVLDLSQTAEEFAALWPTAKIIRKSIRSLTCLSD